MKTARVIFATMLVAAVTSMVVWGCVDFDSGSRAGDRSVTQLTEPSDAIGERLMIALGRAKNFHRKAKVYMADGKVDDAIAAVEQILTVEFPPGAPEGEDVKLDAHALLAKLLLGKGDLERATKVVDDGIAAATRDSFFLGNLHTVRGELLEARAADLDPKTDEGRAARKAAIEAYDASNAIFERVQKRLVEGGP